MRFISDYVHECDFYSSHFLRANKDELVRIHKDFRNDDRRKTNDITLIDTPLNHFFNEPLKKLIEEHYIVKPSPFDLFFNLYIQDNGFSENYFHNHIHSSMTICGVMYLDIPEEGGEIEFIHYPDNGEDNAIKIKPQEDKVYLFPSWLYHRPLSHTSNISRLCINFGYVSDSRPILRNIGILW